MIDENLKFEDALKKLSVITKELEGNELELDESLKLYEQGVKLYNYCRNKLNDYEGKIKMVINDENTLDEIDFKGGE